MSEQINKVLASTAQAFTTAEQKQARDNIDAQKSITYSYSGSKITAIDGTAVGNPAALTGINHDYNLSGLGTTVSLLGLADPIKFSASGTAADSLVSSVSVGNNGFSASVPSAWTAEFTYNRGKFGYEWPSADDTANHEGLTSHTLLVPGNINLSSHDCSYITHNYVDLDVDNGLRMFQGYGSGSNQSGIFACVSGYSNGPTVHFQQGTANEYVDIPSIRKWNGYSAGVSAGNGLTGSGTSSSPLGLANPSIISSNSHSSYRADNFVMVTSNGGDRSYLSEFVLDFQHNGTSYSVTTASINDWNNKLFKSAIECDANSAVTAIGGSSIGGGNGWKESGNPLSTGFGGNQVTAASQYNDGAGNWAARTVKMSGLPDQTMYAFQSKPVGTGTYGVNQAGAFVAVPQSKYFTYLFHETGEVVHTFDIEIYPTGLTADARLDFVNLCSGCSANVKTDTFHGNTANINPGESATMWYIATADIWTDGYNPVPV